MLMEDIPANQLRLVVEIPLFTSFFVHPGWLALGFLPSTVCWKSTGSSQRFLYRRKRPLHSAALNIEDSALGFLLESACWKRPFFGESGTFRWSQKNSVSNVLGPQTAQAPNGSKCLLDKGVPQNVSILLKPTAWSTQTNPALGSTWSTCLCTHEPSYYWNVVPGKADLTF